MNKEMHNEISKIFNGYNISKRKALSIHTMSDQVRQLEREKIRLKRRYDLSLREIREHIDNIEGSLARLLKELE